ncbi:inositol phosphatase/fructose-1,6-bisphosphatase [Paraburkholderia hospita]|uniref:Fructose-1,6-bisphosphatase class 1 n=1 Tax=Paraburkholderia hospita TaxID=169430 RepID=A0ABP2P6M2_9BURK|nr:class 1 fructose-bisphosphatase [Paraburkholderia hospita]EIM93315.1 inositol phosphatase/fructose-1,6-bisphosphatase [Paraburkholderia hospita]OUL77819.1 fructose-bisphosphatase class I [Paraburkholderia hospita]
MPKTTLAQYLIQERRRFSDATGDFNSLILNVATTCKRISRAIEQGALSGVQGDADGAINVQGEQQKKLDVVCNNIFLEVNQEGGNLAGMVSEELEAPYQIPVEYSRGKYLLAFDPLDGSTNVDVNVSVGSVFSVLRAPDNVADIVVESDFLQPGSKQVAAGYAIYGPSTMLVLTVGNGVNGFTLDPNLGEFVLTHPELRVPERTQEFAINASNSRFWEAPIKHYVTECLQGTDGTRGKNFNMRWVASMVAEAHRIVMRGGIFMYPRDGRDPSKAGRLRLLYEANPIAFIMEQAGGRASTGHQPILSVQPTSVHQRIALIFGSREEVERLESYHTGQLPSSLPDPLFQERSLFRESA